MHIRAQNAGVLFTKLAKDVRVEVFELLPCNEAVITTKGRLRRRFPGRALLVKGEIFEEADLQLTIAQALAKMSNQVAAG